MLSFSRVLLAACIVSGLLSPACAQRGKRDRPVQLPTEPFAAEGTVEAVAPGCIRMMTQSDQRWMVYFHPKTVIHVVGTAEADFLRPGLFVRFKAEVDRRSRGKIREKVQELAIFTPFQEPDAAVGLWPEGSEPAGDDPFAKGADAKGSGEGAAGKPPMSQVYTIAGQVGGGRRGKLSVNTGKGVFTFELAEKPKISVDFAEYLVAKSGDKISVTKGKMYAGQMGRASADAVKIELAKPLTTAKKKPVRGRKPATKPSSAKARKADAKPEPAKDEKTADR